MGAASRMGLKRQSGVAATETLLVFVPVLLVVLGIIQLSQILAANLLLEWAAFAAARSAIVALPEGDVAAEMRPDEDPPPPDSVPNVLGARMAPTSRIESAAAAWRQSARYRTIARAAALAMTPVSPPPDRDVGLTVADALDGEALSRDGMSAMSLLARAARKAAGAADSTTVVLISPDGARYVTSFSATAEVGVRVTHLFRCAVPLVNRLLCRRFDDLPERVRRETLALDGGRGVEAAGPSPVRYLALTSVARMRNEGRP